MRILLTGKNGQLGWELHRQLEKDYEILAFGREDVDFLNSRFLASVIRQMPKLDLIINAAAYTNIDRGKYEALAAEAVNVDAAAILAAEAEYRDIPIVHFSTDHVFGRRRRTQPYCEADPPNPVSLYGSTKLAGELRVRSIAEKHWIFRLSGLYGIRRKNFFTQILNSNRQGKVSRVAGDQIISPNWTPLVAEAIVGAIKHLFQGREIPWGVYHLSGSGCTTPYEFARLICEKVNDLWHGTMPLPFAVSSKEIKAASQRPKYSVLDSTRFNETFQHVLPDWREQFLHFFGGIDHNQIMQ